ncbi:MAG: VIT1/CCC1 transporter family protein [Patescibacteria group bacterium]|nr:VIT1/CCC1 transporter family protein [Patescibacteria group bacterium]MCL5431504.1 VIT1/CCC1 transporter family protein [Patescibacteria group bacterium]
METHARVSSLRDLILGGQDGLVNVLGIVLGVSAANGSTQIIIVAGLAAAFAEAVSMGAVAYTSTLAQKDYYEKELEREKNEVETKPEEEKQEIREIYKNKGFSGQVLDDIVTTVSANKDVWVNIMMKDELGLEPVDMTALRRTSAIVFVSALLGSFVPIVPLFFFPRELAAITGVLVSSLVLFAIGVYEAKTYVGNWLVKGGQMVVIGIGAAIAGFVIGRVFQVGP